MPSSPHRARRLLLGLALAGIGAAVAQPAVHTAAGRATGPAAAKLPTLSRQPITVNAASVDVDYKTQTVVYQKVLITQGNIVVRADRARTTVGQSRQQSQWPLKGNVHIQAPPHGTLNADTAIVGVEDNRITRATVTGKPAEFTQQTEGGKVTQGHADQITYDVDRGTVQLSDDAWLSDGRNEISSNLITYDVLKDRIQASSPGSGQRVHLTLTPPSPGTGTKAPKPKPPATPGPRPPQPHGRSS